MSVNEGDAFVAGLDQATAKRLLAAAKKAGLDPSVVRASPADGGFIVPAELTEEPKRNTKTTGKASADESDKK